MCDPSSEVEIAVEDAQMFRLVERDSGKQKMLQQVE